MIQPPARDGHVAPEVYEARQKIQLARIGTLSAAHNNKGCTKDVSLLQSVHMKVGQLPFLLHFNVVTAAPGAPGGCARCARVRGRFLPELVDSRGGVEQPLLSPRRPKHRFVSML